MFETAWDCKANHGLLTNRIAQAVHASHKVLEINPESESATTSLASCYAAQGDVATALALFDKALLLKPDFEDAMLKKIFAMEFLPGADFAAHQAVRREWWDRIGAKQPRSELRPTGLDPEKRIKVGYVSSDFKAHSAALTFMPLLRHHDHRQFEIIAYSCATLRDSTTDQCRALVDVWVDGSCLSDHELADRIRARPGGRPGRPVRPFERQPASRFRPQAGACAGVCLWQRDGYRPSDHGLSAGRSDFCS